MKKLKFLFFPTNQWTKQIGSTANDTGLSLAIDSSGYIYIVGSTYGGIDGNSLITTGGNPDMFIIRFNADGVLQ